MKEASCLNLGTDFLGYILLPFDESGIHIIYWIYFTIWMNVPHRLTIGWYGWGSAWLFTSSSQEWCGWITSNKSTSDIVSGVWAMIMTWRINFSHSCWFDSIRSSTWSQISEGSSGTLLIRPSKARVSILQYHVKSLRFYLLGCTPKWPNENANFWHSTVPRSNLNIIAPKEIFHLH